MSLRTAALYGKHVRNIKKSILPPRTWSHDVRGTRSLITRSVYAGILQPAKHKNLVADSSEWSVGSHYKQSHGLVRYLSAQAAPSCVVDGDKVHIHYQGTLEDGTEFDSSAGREALAFTVGKGEVIPGFETGVLGMTEGETRTLTIEPEQAYGQVDARLKFDIPLDRLPNGVKVGDVLQTQNGGRVKVVEIKSTEAALDANHELAGKKLIFKVELVGRVSKEALGKDVMPEEIILPGDGTTFPTHGDRVTVHYVGSLANGKVFDSSRDRGEPFTFTIGVGQVIAGWDEGVMNMSLGQRAKLYIPSEKGYGRSGAGSAIPPNSDLVFDVEILNIER